MSWFKREKSITPETGERRIRTEGLWTKCDGCRQIIWKKDLEASWNLCPKCGFHFRMDARTRLRLLMDDEKYTEHDSGVESTDPLGFVDLKPYQQRLENAQSATKLSDAMITAEGQMSGRAVMVCAMEYSFIGGSMGCVVGEKI